MSKVRKALSLENRFGYPVWLLLKFHWDFSFSVFAMYVVLPLCIIYPSELLRWFGDYVPHFKTTFLVTTTELKKKVS
jgi:hypothetical protein